MRNVSETVGFMIENFKNSNVTIAEEIEDVKGTISNEELWVKGSDGEAISWHLQNITELKEYLAWLEEQR